MRAALAGLSDAFTARVRQIRVVDVLLAHYARRYSVAELEAIAAPDRADVEPRPTPKGAHERRFLHMSQLPNGTWRGRFACGPAAGTADQAGPGRVLPRPAPARPSTPTASNTTIPDTRDLGARQIDAVTDIITLALAKTGITLPDRPSTRAAAPVPPPGTGDGRGTDGTGDSRGTGTAAAAATGDRTTGRPDRRRAAASGRTSRRGASPDEPWTSR